MPYHYHRRYNLIEYGSVRKQTVILLRRRRRLTLLFQCSTLDTDILLLVNEREKNATALEEAAFFTIFPLSLCFEQYEKKYICDVQDDSTAYGLD